MKSSTGLNKTELFPYCDDMHFPHGFARSGYFTKEQAEILTHYGRHLRELWTEETLPENEIEQDFVKVCQGRLAAESEIEKTWLAYLEAIKQVTSMLYPAHWYEATHLLNEHKNEN